VAEILQLLKVDRDHVISTQNSSSPSRGCQQSLAANILSGRTASVTRRSRKTVKNACSKHLFSLHSPKTDRVRVSWNTRTIITNSSQAGTVQFFQHSLSLLCSFLLLTLRLMEQPVKERDKLPPSV